MITRTRYTALMAILCIPLAAWADTKNKPDKDPGAKSGQAVGKKVLTESEVAAALRGVGVSPALAAALAKKLVNENDPAHQDALKTADLIATIANELSIQLNADPEIISQVVSVIAERGLTDASLGGAARNLAGLGAIDAIAGPGASSQLPQGAGRNADAIARALAWAIAEMHLTGLKAGDPAFDAVISKILGGGLYGSEARKVVHGATDPLVNDPRLGAPAKGKEDKPKSTPPPSGGGGSRPPNDPDLIPGQKPGGRSTGTGSTQGGGGTGSGQTGDSTQPPSAAGKKRGSAVINFDDVPAENSGEDSKTHQSEFDRAAAKKAEEERKAEEKKAAEAKAAEDKAKKEKEDAEKKKGDAPAAADGSESTVETSLDPDGEQAYHGKPTMTGIFARLQRLGVRLGQQTNPNPQNEGSVDRSLPLPDRKSGLIGNPGSGVPRKTMPVIDKANVPAPGPKPGQVNPVPDSTTPPTPRK